MRQSKPIFISALMLTGVNLMLRMVGTSFQVYLSRRIGASGIGLLQLILSTGNLALVAGLGGIRTAAMYLTAEELGRRKPERTSRILSACLLYSICISSAVAVLLLLSAPFLAAYWIGNDAALPSLRLFAAFLPTVCLCGVMSGYFTAEKRIGTLAAVQIAEQLCTVVFTLAALTFWAGSSTERACISVILGNSIGAAITLVTLVILRCLEHPQHSAPFPVAKQLCAAALPLASADVIRSGISTTEHLMVPKRLRLFRGEQDPLSAFGRIHGMVFPIMMFPACILFALAELLIPELAECRAAGLQQRIRHLVNRGLWTAMIYGVFFGGLLSLLAEPLCVHLYASPEAGQWLRRFCLMVPFLYCDTVTDAMTKGLGQQKVCVRYNIFTSALDVIFLFLLLPHYGMNGYYFSFLVTHLFNFALSLRRLLLITGCRIPFYRPALAVSAGLLSVLLASQTIWVVYIPSFFLALRLFGVVTSQDIQWLFRLPRPVLRA